MGVSGSIRGWTEAPPLGILTNEKKKNVLPTMTNE